MVEQHTGRLIWMRAVGVALVWSLLLAGCTLFGVRTSGVSGPVDWRTTDFEWHPEAFGEQVYTFTLLLRETQGRDLTFTQAAPPLSLCAVLGLGARAHASVAPDPDRDGAGRPAGPAGPGPAFPRHPQRGAHVLTSP